MNISPCTHALRYLLESQFNSIPRARVCVRACLERASAKFRKRENKEHYLLARVQEEGTISG